MTRQKSEVAQQMHPGWGHCSAQAHQQVIGHELDGSGAVFPDIFEPQLQPPVNAQRESVLREWRAGDVADKVARLAFYPDQRRVAWVI